jgi:hypothetical protein
MFYFYLLQTVQLNLVLYTKNNFKLVYDRVVYGGLLNFEKFNRIYAIFFDLGLK